MACQTWLYSQFDGFHAAVHPKFVNDIREMEFDRTEAHYKYFGNFIVIKSSYHALDDIAIAFGRLFARVLWLRRRIRQRLRAIRLRGYDSAPHWPSSCSLQNCRFFPYTHMRHALAFVV